jgi:S1-C subfamily serine protease
LGFGYGNYGYGYFPWYAGLATYGLGRGYGYGGYVGQSAPVIVERYAEPAAPAPPENDYVPQLNSTTAQLGAQPSGAAILGVTMDPEYPNAAVVRQVTPGSSAEKAGMRAGDMITTIEKRQIQSPTDVTNLVAAMQPGAMIEMEFIRPVLRSEVKEAAPEKGLGVTAPSTEAAESIPPPVPQPPAAD